MLLFVNCAAVVFEETGTLASRPLLLQYYKSYFAECSGLPLFDYLNFCLFIGLCQVLVTARGIFSCGMRTLSCSMWDLVPWPEIE